MDIVSVKGEIIMDKDDFKIDESHSAGEIVKVFVIILVCVYTFMCVAGSFMMQ